MKKYKEYEKEILSLVDELNFKQRNLYVDSKNILILGLKFEEKKLKIHRCSLTL